MVVSSWRESAVSKSQFVSLTHRYRVLQTLLKQLHSFKCKASPKPKAVAGGTAGPVKVSVRRLDLLSERCLPYRPTQPLLFDGSSVGKGVVVVGCCSGRRPPTGKTSRELAAARTWITLVIAIGPFLSWNRVLAQPRLM
jgi:hypothetical protein